MGAYLGIYFGVYLEVPYKKVEVPKVRYKNPKTGLPSQYAFNPKTGEKSIEEPYTEMENKLPNPYDLSSLNLGMDDDYFWIPEHDGFKEHGKTFLLNKRTKYSTEINEEHAFNQDVTQLNGTQLIEEFKVEHKAYLDYFEKEYGKVNVRYGIAVYYH